MAPRLARASALIVPMGLVSALALGCNRADNAADRHAAEMRDSITRLQADQDKLDQRLGVVEVVQAEEKQEKQAQKAAAAIPPRVVQLGGPAEPDSEDPNAPDARPEIRVVGQPGAYRPARGKSRMDEPTQLGAIGESTPRSSALDPEAKKTYEQGLSLVQGKQYAKGNEALAAFLVRWPDHPYAENATYWRGEAFFAQGEYLRAAEQFEAVLNRAGAGNKSPDALLKLGMCHDRLGSSQRAQEYWDKLRNDFPRSDAAKKIPASAGQKTDRSPKGPKESR